MESAPRAYRLTASNAAHLFSTFLGTSPGASPRRGCVSCRRDPKLFQGFPNFSKEFPNFSKLFQGFPNFSKLFQGFPNFSKLFQGFPNFFPWSFRGKSRGYRPVRPESRFLQFFARPRPRDRRPAIPCRTHSRFNIARILIIGKKLSRRLPGADSGQARNRTRRRESRPPRRRRRATSAESAVDLMEARSSEAEKLSRGEARPRRRGA